MSRRSEIPVRRQIVYAAVVVVAFFALAEGGLALFGVRPIAAIADPYVGFSDYYPLFVEGDDGRMVTAGNKLALFNAQSFERSKKPGSFRIFTLGGSTTYGRPFDDGTSFTGWLRTYLEAIDEDRRWEVVNAGGISYASYRVARLMEELVEYEPDLFVIYSGNNEFLEKRTYGELIESLDDPGALRRGRSVLQRTRIWAAGRRLLRSGSDDAARRYELTGEVEELLNTSAGLDHYSRDDAFEQGVFNHYRFNIQRMIDLAREVGARVVLVTVPVNEKDFPPFKSQHADGVDDGGLPDEAAERLEAGDAEAARRLAEQAVALDPLHADSHFVLGRALTALGVGDEAAGAYARALAEDVCPLRAGAEIDAMIREVAASNGVDVIDYRGLLKTRADHGILGEEFFFDHVHPRPEANGLLAEALVGWMERSGILPPGSGESVAPEVHDTVLARVDDEAEARAYKNLAKVLVWAGKPAAAETYLARAGDALDADWEAQYNTGLVHLAAQRYGQAIGSLERAVTLNPSAAAAHDRLAAAYASQGRLDDAVEAGRRATREDPTLAIAWSNLSTHLASAGDNREALASAAEALRLDPGLADAHNNMGNVFLDTGRAEEALESYENALERRPGFVDAQVNRGLALGELGRFREALEAMDAALAREPTLARAHLGRAKARLALGEVAAAVEPLERTIELEPSEQESYGLLVGAFETLGRPDRAREVVEHALSTLPDSGKLHHLKGRMAAGAGDLEAATRAFSRAVALSPDLVAARADLARVLLMQGRVEEAIPHLEHAARSAPDNAGVLVDLALVREHLGDRVQALELFNRALALAPGMVPARDGVRRLTASVP